MSRPQAQGLVHSIQTRLKNQAKSAGRPFTEFLELFAIERFLHRLGRSNQRGRFVLKGALLLRAWLGADTRPTRDIDLLGSPDLDAAVLRAFLEEVVEVEVEEDGIELLPESLSIHPIRLTSPLNGLRAKLDARLGNVRLRYQIDVGLGDEVFPPAEEIVPGGMLGFPSAGPVRLRSDSMAQATSIEWTEATWNPVTGCTKVSPGCKHCYAERMAKRLRAMGQPRYANGFRVTLQEDLIEQPLRWTAPRRIFVNSMSDLFHPDVPEAFIGRIFRTMEEARWHEFQILTKRPERLRALADRLPWPENVWMGVSVENEDYLWRLDPLVAVPAAVRFLSLEPLPERNPPAHFEEPGHGLAGLDTVVSEADPRRDVVAQDDPVLACGPIQLDRVEGGRELHVLDADDVDAVVAAPEAAEDVVVEVLSSAA